MNNDNLFDFNDELNAAPTAPVTLAVQELDPKGTNETRGSEGVAPLQYLLCCEGLELAIDAQMAMNDDAIRTTFVNSLPEIATTKFTRAVSDGVLRVTGVKQPMPMVGVDAPALVSTSAPTTAKPGTTEESAEVVVPQLTYLLCIEGKELAIDAEIAADDDSIKAALATAYPEITTAEVTRTTKDGQQRITVIKRGGPKGTGSLDQRQVRRVKTRLVQVATQSDHDEVERIGRAMNRMMTAPRRFNPLIAVHYELEQQRQAGQLDLITLMLCQGQIERALIEGPKEAQQMERALARMIESPPAAWRRVPVGF